MFCYLLTKNKHVQIRQKIAMITLFYFYPLLDAQFVKNRIQLVCSMQYNDSSAKYRCNSIDV